MNADHINGGLLAIPVCLIVVGTLFGTGLLTTSGGADAAANESAHEELVDRYATICVEQFMQDFSTERERAGALLRVANTRFTQQMNHVAENGWATMPGSEEPLKGVPFECANRLVAMAPTSSSGIEFQPTLAEEAAERQ